MSVAVKEAAQVTCSACSKAESMGGAVRCMACGRWVPRVDRFRSATTPIPLGLAGHDRRSRKRLADPPCPRCTAEEQQPRVTIRQPHRVFYKCARCFSVWTLEVRRR